MEPHLNFWIEIDGEVAASRWRLRLLEAVAEHGSISAAARAMEVPYRVAWRKVREMEQRLGLRLLETQTGGHQGGGARLTPAGRDHIARMRAFCDRSDAAVRRIYGEVFGSPPGA